MTREEDPYLINQLLGLPEHPFFIFLTISVGGLLLFFTLAGVSYRLFFIDSRFHPDFDPADPANRREVREGIKWSIIAVFSQAALVAPIHYLLATGHGRLYTDVADYGWAWLLASPLVVLLVSETTIYWVHRGLHWGPLYRNVHDKHHAFKVPTPFTGLAFRPLDAFAQGIPHHVLAFLVPIHIGIYLVSLSFVTVWAVLIHDRVSFVRWKGINFTGHHTLHHWYETYNFGQYFTFWDRLMGTYRDPDVAYDDLPAGLVVRAQNVMGAAPSSSVEIG
jgi:lathosterol oxidase